MRAKQHAGGWRAALRVLAIAAALLGWVRVTMAQPIGPAPAGGAPTAEPAAAAPAAEQVETPAAQPESASPAEPTPESAPAPGTAPESSSGASNPATAAVAPPAPAAVQVAPPPVKLATPPHPSAAEPAREPNPAKPARSWLGAGVALGVLNLPKLGAGAELVGELRVPGMWPIDLAFVYFFDNDAVLDRDELDLRAHPLISVPFPQGGSRLTLNALQASAAVCPYERDLTPGSLLACVGVQGGALRVRGQGFATARETAHPLFALEAYARWRFPVSDTVGVSYSAGVFVPFLRDRFGYQNRSLGFTEKFRAAPLGGRLDLVLTYDF